MLIPLYLLALLTLDVASSSGVVDIGVARVEVDNGKTDHCADAPTGLCLLGGQVDGAGGTWLDIDQRVNYVGVAVDDSPLEDMLNHELLPDRSVTFFASSLYREHPIFVILVENFEDGIHGPGEIGRHFGAAITPKGLRIDYAWIDVENPHEGIYQGDGHVDFGDFLGYDRIGPVHGLGGFSSDALVVNQAESICDLKDELDCGSIADEVSNHWMHSTPALYYGIEIYDAELATDPSLLGSGDTDQSRIATGDLDHRRVDPALPLASFSAAEPLSHSLLPGPEHYPQLDPLFRPGPTEPPDSPPTRVRNAEDPGGSGRPPLIPLTAAFALAVLAAVLYSRLKREDLIQAPHRARILAALEERGPLRLAELARLVGVDRTTVCYHAELLGRAGLVQALRAGRSAYLGLPRQQLPPSSRAGGELGVAVRELLALHGGQLPRAQVHEMLPGVPQRTRNYALRQLLAAGAVLETPSEGGTLLSLAR